MLQQLGLESAALDTARPGSSVGPDRSEPAAALPSTVLARAPGRRQRMALGENTSLYKAVACAADTALAKESLVRPSHLDWSLRRLCACLGKAGTTCWSAAGPPRGAAPGPARRDMQCMIAIARAYIIRHRVLRLRKGPRLRNFGQTCNQFSPHRNFETAAVSGPGFEGTSPDTSQESGATHPPRTVARWYSGKPFRV